VVGGRRGKRKKSSQKFLFFFLTIREKDGRFVRLALFPPSLPLSLSSSPLVFLLSVCLSICSVHLPFFLSFHPSDHLYLCWNLRPILVTTQTAKEENGNGENPDHYTQTQFRIKARILSSMCVVMKYGKGMQDPSQCQTRSEMCYCLSSFIFNSQFKVNNQTLDYSTIQNGLYCVISFTKSCIFSCI
jgi:hypothetical protein